METEVQNNAAVEIARRKAIVEARERQVGADKIHRENVPDNRPVSKPSASGERIKLAEYDRNDWVLNVESHHSIEDLLQPSYWAHVCQQFSPYDKIEARAEDGTWIADLVVLQVERGWAKVFLKAKFEFHLLDAPSAEIKHVVKWAGPQRRFAVMRMSDQIYIRDKFATREEADAWMKEHEKVIST